ncbi:MAG: nucleotide exchange factor GrpE [Gammaproteobacteria bacterium]|nr:nucleotide exchange factor GrpE [Gammaproteobacteria bacterium]
MSSEETVGDKSTAEPGVAEATNEEGAATVDAAEPSHEETVQLLEDARAKADENWDAALRLQAEIENLKKRNQRDLENAHKFALDKVTDQLLPVMDSLIMGLDAAAQEAATMESIHEGSELTLKMLESVFEKMGITAIDPSGETFDPEQHQAMSMVESDDHEPNSVVSVMQKGYLLNGRLIRPAMVMVAKA